MSRRALIAIMIVMSFLSSAFLSPGNLANVAKNFSFVGIVTLGVTLVIVTGGIDLSVGSMMALSAITCAIVMQALSGTGLRRHSARRHDRLARLPVSVSRAADRPCQRPLIARVGLSPFVTTLGMLSIVRGLAYAVTEGRGSLPTGPDVDLFYGITDGNLAGVPVAVIYLLVLAAIMGVVLHHTAFGRHVFALGGNEKAAALTGIAGRAGEDRGLCDLRARRGLCRHPDGGLARLGAGQSGDRLRAQRSSPRRSSAAPTSPAASAGRRAPSIGALLIEVIRNGLVLAQASMPTGRSCWSARSSSSRSWSTACGRSRMTA